MKIVRVSRSNFWQMYSWINYFKFVLNKKYHVIPDGKNPDIVFWTNLQTNKNDFDQFIQDNYKEIDEYKDCKKIFISGEIFKDYYSMLNYSDKNFVIGVEYIDHPRYLRFPTCVLDCWTLFDESRLFDTPFHWLIEEKDPEKIILEKKYFCSIVQGSHNDYRARIFDLLEKIDHVRSSGPWRGTLGLDLNKNKFINNNYTGRMDGLVYRDKINFFRDCKFNIAFQFTNTINVTQEKLVHAMAANTIPIFYGNQNILREGFNEDSFINVHKYSSFEEAVEDIKDLHLNSDRYKEKISQPWFVNNKLSKYFDCNYLLDFFEKVIES
jgi:hypothetical protein